MPLFSNIYNPYNTKDLTKAQKWLQNCGSKIQVTGQWSIAMRSALCCFQRKAGILITGELDLDTWKELKRQNRWWKRLAKKFCGHKR